MFKSPLKIALLAIGITACGYATAGGRPSPGAMPPTIVKVAMDARKNALIITGWNFGSTSPTVRLADEVLDVKSFSDNRVVASLPANIEPATYRLTVTATGRNRLTSDVFSAAVAGVAVVTAGSVE